MTSPPHRVPLEPTPPKAESTSGSARRRPQHSSSQLSPNVHDLTPLMGVMIDAVMSESITCSSHAVTPCPVAPEDYEFPAGGDGPLPFRDSTSVRPDADAEPHTVRTKPAVDTYASLKLDKTMPVCDKEQEVPTTPAIAEAAKVVFDVEESRVKPSMKTFLRTAIPHLLRNSGSNVVMAEALEQSRQRCLSDSDLVSPVCKQCEAYIAAYVAMVDHMHNEQQNSYIRAVNKLHSLSRTPEAAAIGSRRTSMCRRRISDHRVGRMPSLNLPDAQRFSVSEAGVASPMLEAGSPNHPPPSTVVGQRPPAPSRDATMDSMLGSYVGTDAAYAMEASSSKADLIGSIAAYFGDAKATANAQL